MRLIYLSVFVAATASVLLTASLEPNSSAANIVNAAWLLAPYAVLIALIIARRRTSLMATAVATLLAAAGTLASLLVMRIFASDAERDIVARFVPMYQATAIAVLIPVCRWLVGKVA